MEHGSRVSQLGLNTLCGRVRATVEIRASLKLCFEEQLDWTLDDIPREFNEKLDWLPRYPGDQVFWR